MSSDTVIYRFIGANGAFHEGIPARDLTYADVRRLSRTLRGAVRTSPLYKIVVSQRVARDGPEEGQVHELLEAIEPETVVEVDVEPETVEPETVEPETVEEVTEEFRAESDATELAQDEEPDVKPRRRRKKEEEE